jgi:hypothetical protein
MVFLLILLVLINFEPIPFFNFSTHWYTNEFHYKQVPKNIYLEVFNAGFCSFSRNRMVPINNDFIVFWRFAFFNPEIRKKWGPIIMV